MSLLASEIAQMRTSAETLPAVSPVRVAVLRALDVLEQQAAGSADAADLAAIAQEILMEEEKDNEMKQAEIEEDMIARGLLRRADSLDAEGTEIVYETRASLQAAIEDADEERVRHLLEMGHATGMLQLRSIQY